MTARPEGDFDDVIAFAWNGPAGSVADAARLLLLPLRRWTRKKTPEEESPKKESVHISVEEDEELEEEPHSDDETPLPSDKLGSLTSSVRVSRGTWKPEPAGVKNGDILKKLESGDFVLAWGILFVQDIQYTTQMKE